ncbi:hypothetical protein DFJ77DRAFT_83179 [Powellomyces hirtus]|nr:hypothetical protein DFJ77DRAFT_83179 [Powellomyces hirtus]
MKALSRALPASSQQDGSGAGRASPSSSAGLRSAKRSISAAAVTSVSASHTPRTTGSELDKLMKQSVEAILHCYERRAKDFTHVEGLAASQRHQISALESALSQLRRENAELKQEKTALHASQNLLLARYAALKKNVSQLESFRQPPWWKVRLESTKL